MNDISYSAFKFFIRYYIEHKSMFYFNFFFLVGKTNYYTNLFIISSLVILVKINIDPSKKVKSQHNFIMHFIISIISLYL